MLYQLQCSPLLRNSTHWTKQTNRDHGEQVEVQGRAGPQSSVISLRTEEGSMQIPFTPEFFWSFGTEHFPWRALSCSLSTLLCMCCHSFLGSLSLLTSVITRQAWQASFKGARNCLCIKKLLKANPQWSLLSEILPFAKGLSQCS